MAIQLAHYSIDHCELIWTLGKMHSFDQSIVEVCWFVQRSFFTVATDMSWISRAVSRVQFSVHLIQTTVRLTMNIDKYQVKV